MSAARASLVATIALAACTATGDAHINVAVSFMRADVASCYAANPDAVSSCCRVATFSPDGTASLIEAFEGSPPGHYSADGAQLSGTIWYGEAFSFDLTTLTGTGALGGFTWADDDPTWDAKVCNGPF